MTVVTTTLVDFLLARIAEDEAAARACVGPEWQTGLPATIHPNPETYRTVVRQLGHVCGSIISADAEHIARHDPARVLADCESQRQIIDAELRQMLGGPSGYISQDVYERIRARAESDVLRALALPYGDHPDYDEAWKL